MIKSHGNMYSWLSHTWNPTKGPCPHECAYCYVPRIAHRFSKDVGELRLDEKALNENLGEGNFIFVESSCDLFAKDIPHAWTRRVLEQCCKFDKNTYLLQTKNPHGAAYFEKWMPKDFFFGTTLETNRHIPSIMGNTPTPGNRCGWMASVKDSTMGARKTMVSIEPIMAFDRGEFLGMLQEIHPDFISIGADTGGCNLPEPTKEDVDWLLTELRRIMPDVEIKVKDNLRRLM